MKILENLNNIIFLSILLLMLLSLILELFNNDKCYHCEDFKLHIQQLQQIEENYENLKIKFNEIKDNINSISIKDNCRCRTRHELKENHDNLKNQFNEIKKNINSIKKKCGCRADKKCYHEFRMKKLELN